MDDPKISLSDKIIAKVHHVAHVKPTAILSDRC